MPDPSQGNIVSRSLELAFTVDAFESKAYIQALRARYPEFERRELADHMIRRAQWWGAGLGFATGVAGNPWIAAQASIADMAALLRTEILLACRIGLLFDEKLLDGEEPPYELLVPIMGGRAAGELARSALALGGMELTRQALLKFMRRDGIRQLERIMLKQFGVRLSRRALVTKTVPVVGGVIGGGWNYLELKLVGDRVYKYFDKGAATACGQQGGPPPGSDADGGYDG